MISPEDNDLLDNPKYRQYINSIEKALKSFESSSEWADLIAALGKLNKVLNPKFKVIPRKITIGKRLAQCMHPALPGGVHLKALDVYESIFKIIETKRLQTDLYVYSMGIFPLLVNASMQVRPVLLNMYETYFLPLGKSLQHCIDGMLLALLPGLEEGTELFERTDILLVRVCEKTGDLEFYGALWRCILSSSATRLYAVQLILRRFDRRKTTDDQLFIIGSDIEIMVRALCESLQDNSVLTQRASLDILTLCCPLSHIPISRADCCELLQAALSCLLRRDMSLNRRIYSWLLGHDQTKMRSSTSSLEQEENLYFDTYAKALLTEALALMLGRQINKLTKFDTNFQISASDELFPLRLLVSLLDKQEIGPMIIEDVLVEVFRLLQAAVHFVDKKYDSENFVEDDVDKATRISEISKTANLLLGVFEPGYLWQFLSQQIAQARKHKRRDEKVAIPFRELCGFIQLLLVISSVESYLEVQTHHLPNLLFQMIILFSENVTKLSAAELKQGLETCSTLLELTQPVQPPNFGSLPDENNYIVGQSSPVHYSTVPRDNGYGHDITQCFQVFQEFFCNFVKHRLGGSRSDVERCLRNLESVGAQRDITQDHNFKSSKNTPPSSVVFHVSGNIGSKGTLKDVELVDIFQLTCQMMVDFSCFPLYCNGRLNRHTQKLEITCDSFPHWLKTLLWCICDCSINASFEICTISISALLDMMSLTNSARRGNSSDNTSIGPGMNCAGMVSVVVLSPMTSNHVTALTNQSSFYQKITRRLWKVLGDDDQYEHHLSAVHLLLRLHAVCPDRRCEEVLLTDMLHCNKDTRLKALEKFTRLWHLTRTLSTKKVSLQNGVNFKHFFRCLFAILDSLNPSLQSTQTSSLFELDCGGRSVAQATASSWLQQCLEERDLVRVLEPLLTVLLHPSTHSKYLDSKDVFKDEHNIPNSSGPSKVIQSQDARGKNDGPHVNESEVINDIVKGKMHYSDLILSLTARSFVEKSDELEAKAEQIVKEVLESVLKKLQEEELPCETDPNTTKFDVGPAAGSSLRKTSDDFSRKCSNLNTFTLLYQENFDASRVLYSLRSILTMLQTHPRLFTYTAVTSQLSAYTSQSVGGVLIQDLLSRHMQALSGRSFYAEVMSRSHNVMVVDLLFVVCLHYIRSWHPDDVIDPDTLHDIRFASCKLLLSFLEHMTDLARENVAASSNMTSPIASSSIAMSSQQFTPFVRSILNKYDVSKMVLESLFATVQALHVSSGEDVKRPVTVTRSTLGSLNDEELYFWWSGNNLARIKSFQAHLLTLVRALLTFDYHLMETDDYSSNETPAKPDEVLPANQSRPIYEHNLPVAKQALLTTSLIRILRLQSACDVHVIWLDTMMSSLPFLSNALPELAAPVTSQLCRNLETAADLYVTWNDNERCNCLPPMPAGYVITLLKALRTLTHFTLLLHTGSGLQNPAQAAGQLIKERAGSSAPSSGNQTLNNTGFSALGSLFNVFTPNSSLKTQRSVEEQILSTESLESRKSTLQSLPRLVSSLAVVWDRVVARSSGYVAGEKNRKLLGHLNPCVAMGDGESVSQNVLQLLNPLAMQYGESLLSGLAIVWERRGRDQQPTDKLPTKELCEEQMQLLNVVCSVRSLQCDVTLGLVKRVIMKPPEFPAPKSVKSRKTSFEECLLDFSLRYLRRQNVQSLKESWSSVLALLRDCLSLGPPVTPTGGSSTSGTAGPGRRQLSPRFHFLLLLLVAEYARRVPPFEDKKDQKDLQDICVKCIEACNDIVNCSLEYGGWLVRRPPSVVSQPQAPVVKQSSKLITESASSVEFLDSNANKNSTQLKITTSDPGLDSPTEPPNSLSISTSTLPPVTKPHYESSVQALNLLAQVVANLLDVTYGSEEKDKTVPVLTPIMANVTPYLKNHSLKNVASYMAAVKLLSSVSGYQQTRRAWKRDAYELFLAPDFFQMPLDSATEWRNVIDHLMTHDATTFKELMVRIGMTRNAASGPSLNIFSNKEQELEQRATLLKRLAFVIFSSGLNQYQRHLPEIQERLSESLKLHQVPAVQEQVFHCFRVLLLRVSPNHLTSLWPSIITELVQVLGQMEQDLILRDYDDTIDKESAEIRSKPNSSTPTNGVSGLFSNLSNSPSASYVQERWMKMYLSACKLLDLVLTLQSTQLNHFKIFRWSFVGEPGDVFDDVKDEEEAESDEDDDLNKSRFVPHCVRIKRLMSKKHPSDKLSLLDVSPLRPLLDMRRMTSLYQLQPFFNTIVSPSLVLTSHEPKLSAGSTSSDSNKCSSPFIKRLLLKDFVEAMT